MIPVLAGTSLAFEYTAYDGITTLNVAMQIYDVTTGTPSFVTTAAMSHMLNGTYIGYFTPVSGKQYAINKMVYTDGTYTTPSPSYSPGSETIQASTEQTQITSMQTVLNTVNTNVSSVQTDTSTLTSRLTAGRAANLDNLDAAVSSRASQNSIDQIQNNTSFVGIVPASLLLPATGSTTYALYASLYDEIGSPVDPDSQTLNIEIITAGGAVIVPTVAMTRDGLGRYHYNYTVNSTDAIQPLTILFTYNYLSIPFTQLRVTQTTEFESSLDTLLNRLTATRAANLDNLDASVSSRASAAAVSAIQTIVNQLHFNGNNVLAETVINDDKAGYTFSPTLVQNIVNAIWDELLSNHTTTGTTGAAQNLLSGISSKTTNLPSDPASESGIIAEIDSKTSSIPAISTEVAAIKTKTDNLPVDPASATAIAAIPTNPLLTTDTRLNHLDANVSGRVAPSDLVLLAKTTDVTTAESSILSSISTVEANIAPLATTTQVNAAVSTLAQQTTLLNVQSDILSVQSELITASDVWTYTPRSLTQAVTTTDDLSGLAKTTDVAAAESNIIAAIPQFECCMVTAIDPSLDEGTFQVWLTQGNTVVSGVQTAQVDVYNSLGNPVIMGLSSTVASAQNIFTLRYNEASVILFANQAYSVVITMVKGINTYRSIKTMTVF